MTMRKRTPIIRYNLSERMRLYTGVDRKIDIPASMRVINGPVVQEQIRKGDIFGYAGHTWREKYGLDVPESVIVDGKTVVLEPAVKTVLLKLLPDGTIEHQQEFLNTSSGRIAARLFDTGAWGFSSAFHAPEIGGVRVIQQYFGMDFVKNPNYDTNRGYDSLLDSTGAGAMSSDGFASELAAMLDSVDSLMAANEAMATDMSQAYLAQCKANDELVEHNALLLEQLRAFKRGTGGMLDSATPGQAPDTLVRGMTIDRSVGAAMLDSATRFMAVEHLVQLEESPEEKAADKENKTFLAKARDTVNKVLGVA